MFVFGTATLVSATMTYYLAISRFIRYSIGATPFYNHVLIAVSLMQVFIVSEVIRFIAATIVMLKGSTTGGVYASVFSE